MKALHGLFLLMTLSLFLVSCGTDAGDNSTASKTTADAKKEVASTQVAPAKKSGTAESDEELPGGVEVKSTQKIEEAPVDDANVDYKKLANAICKCGAKVKVQDGQKSDAYVSVDDTEYQKEVDCAMAAKNSMTEGEISRQKLVTAITSECNDIPGKLVLRLMMTLGK